jgi:phosphoribulokinase
VPTIDTSNPFAAEGIPRPEESFLVIRFARADSMELEGLRDNIAQSFISVTTRSWCLAPRRRRRCI